MDQDITSHNSDNWSLRQIIKLLLSIILSVIFVKLVVKKVENDNRFQQSMDQIFLIYDEKNLKISENQILKTSKGDQSRQVPFYIYDFPETNWYRACLHTFPYLNYSSKTNSKRHWYYHSDDFIFSEQSLHHPWRVSNPDQAQVFILPTLFGFFSGFGDHASDADPDKEKVLDNFQHRAGWNIEHLKCGGLPVIEDENGTKVYSIHGYNAPLTPLTPQAF